MMPKHLPGKKWWEAHRPFWREVLAVWSDIYARRKDIAFKEKRRRQQNLPKPCSKLDEESPQANRNHQSA
jgi:hypothetical protein